MSQCGEDWIALISILFFLPSISRWMKCLRRFSKDDGRNGRGAPELLDVNYDPSRLRTVLADVGGELPVKVLLH